MGKTEFPFLVFPYFPVMPISSHVASERRNDHSVVTTSIIGRQVWKKLPCFQIQKMDTCAKTEFPRCPRGVLHKRRWVCWVSRVTVQKACHGASCESGVRTRVEASEEHPAACDSRVKQTTTPPPTMRPLLNTFCMVLIVHLWVDASHCLRNNAKSRGVCFANPR